MTNSRIKKWVRKITTVYGLTDKKLAQCLLSGSRRITGLECPSWISYGTEWENRKNIGLLIYDETLDLERTDDQSETDRYLIKK